MVGTYALDVLVHINAIAHTWVHFLIMHGYNLLLSRPCDLKLLNIVSVIPVDHGSTQEDTFF